MASDSREEQPVLVDLPAELSDWIDERATALDVDRRDVVVQLLSAYRAADATDGDLDLGDVVDFEEPPAAFESAVDERVEEAVDAALAERLPQVADAVAEERDADAAAVGERLEAEMADLESTFRDKIEDVRERVVQVKRETDGKAPRDHDHEAIGALRADLADVETALSDLEDRLAEREAGDDVEGRLDDLSEKLDRVAWVVSDLKDDVGGRDARERAVTSIKRAAAREGVEAAHCEACGERVAVALLTAPECPHCEATVSDVRPAGGLFRRKARLVTAAQLEAGDEEEP